MNNYTVDDFTVTLTINTVHNEYTEFVLDQATERNNKTVCFYYDQLVNGISKAFDDKTWRLEGYEVYYHFRIKVSISDRSDYENMISIVDKCIIDWKNKYNIEKMLNPDLV